MAAQTGSDEKKQDVIIGGGGIGPVDPLFVWLPVIGSEMKTALKEVMSNVKEAFLEKAAKMGLKIESNGYNVTENGEFRIDISNGLQEFIGLIKLSVKVSEKERKDFYGSVRVQPAEVGTGPVTIWELKGFMIDESPVLSFVFVGQYQIKFAYLPYWWFRCESETWIKSMKGAITAVKDQFMAKIASFGFEFGTEYRVMDEGLYFDTFPLIDDNAQYIGLVALAPKGSFPGFYASVRASMFVSPDAKWQLDGFIASSTPCLQFVNSNQYMVQLDEMTVKSPKIATSSKDDKQNKMMIGYNGNGAMQFADTSTLQNLIDLAKLKDAIKKKAGVYRNLSAFQVAMATQQITPIHVGPLSPIFYLTAYTVKIWTGMDPATKFPSYIYVTMLHGQGDKAADVLIIQAITAPF